MGMLEAGVLAIVPGLITAHCRVNAMKKPTRPLKPG
jgi:hypothetical protein